MKNYKWAEYEGNIIFSPEQNGPIYTVIYYYDDTDEDILDYWDAETADIVYIFDKEKHMSIKDKISFILNNTQAMKYYKKDSNKKDLIKHIFGDL